MFYSLIYVTIEYILENIIEPYSQGSTPKYTCKKYDQETSVPLMMRFVAHDLALSWAQANLSPEQYQTIRKSYNTLFKRTAIFVVACCIPVMLLFLAIMDIKPLSGREEAILKVVPIEDGLSLQNIEMIIAFGGAIIAPVLLVLCVYMPISYSTFGKPWKQFLRTYNGK